MHYISSGCWNLLPCILKTHSCTFFGSGRNLSSKAPPSLSDTELGITTSWFPFSTKKWQNEPISRLPPRSKIPTLSASEKAVCLVSFSSMVRHDCLHRTNHHATSLKYAGPTLKINVLHGSREKTATRKDSGCNWLEDAFVCKNYHRLCYYQCTILFSTPLQYYLSIPSVLIGKTDSG